MKSIKLVFLHSLILISFSSILVAQPDTNHKTNALVSTFQVNDNAGNTIQNESAIVEDRNGNFIAVWEDKRDEFNFSLDLGFNASPGGDIYAQRLDSNGNLIGSNFKVNDDAGYLGQHLPDVAAGGNGTFIVVWVDGRQDVIDEDIFHVYAQRFNETGTPLGANFKVSEEANNREIYEYFSPVVAADASGNFVVSWEEMINDSLRICAQRFSHDGSPQGSNFIVDNFLGSEDSYSPQIAMNGSGEFVITWFGTYTDDRNADIYAQWFSADGTAQGSSIIVDDYLVEEVVAYNPRIGMDDAGNTLIAWKDAREGYHDQAIYAQWFALNGSRLGKNFRINEEQSTVDSYSEEDFDLAVTPNGSFCVVWYNPQTARLSARRFSSDSTAQGHNFPISPEPGISRPANQPDVAINSSGQVMVTWTDESDYSEVSYSNYFTDIFAQNIENDSTLLSESIELNDDTGSGLQKNPAIATGTEGTFIIAWEDPVNDEADIYMRRYSYNGVMLGEQLRVNDDELGNKNSAPAVAVDSSGLIMVVWEDYRGPVSLIYGQFYAKDGTAIDSNFVLDGGLGYGYYNKPKAAALENGLFIITWQISLYDIGAQIYSLENGPVGSAFYVNDIIDWQIRLNPAVAANDSGSFVITWEDKRNGSADIYAQRYDKSGAMSGSNFKVNDNGSWGAYPSLAFKKDGVLNIIFVSDQIRGQRFGPVGTMVGSNYTISDSPAPRTFFQNTNIAVEESGKFIASWELISVDELTSNVFAQRLSDEGTYLGEEFQLIDSHTEKVLHHNLQVWENRIYTTWIDNNYAGTSWDVYANVLDFDNPNVTVLEEDTHVISKFQLNQNYPNPFNPQTVISYQLPVSSQVTLKIYTILGQQVKTLVSEKQSAGVHQVIWNAGSLSSGFYIYTLETAKITLSKRMLLLR